MGKRCRYFLMFNPISMVLFCLLPSIESRRGLFFALVKETIKEYYHRLSKTGSLAPPKGKIYLAYISKKPFLRYQLFVPGLTNETIDLFNPRYMVLGFRRKAEDSFQHNNIDSVPFCISEPTDTNGCTLTIPTWFVYRYMDTIRDGKHEFIVYFVY